MASVESWIEKQFQGSSTERSLEMVSVTMGIRGAGKAASELANIDSKSFMASFSPIAFAMRYTQLSTFIIMAPREVDIPTDEPLQPDTQPDSSATSTHSWCFPQSLGDILASPWEEATSRQLRAV